MTHSIALPVLSNHARLEQALHLLFPNHQVIKNARKAANIEATTNSDESGSGYFLELDFWLPHLMLAFEFQDPHHYADGWFADPHEFQKRDDKKKMAMIERRESLVVVPCWWDGSLDSLAASIQLERPDLLLDYKFSSTDRITPISNVPPENFFGDKEVPTVGILMTPSFLSNLQFDPKKWWISEKFDGVRACWVPTAETLYSRLASAIAVPSAFRQSLSSKTVIDGELWLGRGSGREAQKLSFSKQLIADYSYPWENLRFIAFDQPIQSLPFEQRYESLLLIPPSPCTIVSAQNKCFSKVLLGIVLGQILQCQGEGVVLRKQGSLYVNGKSSEAVKIKALRDQEGLVVDLCEERDMVLLQLTDGTTFKAKVTEAESLDLKQGDVVTFTYESFSGSVPVSPVVTHIRYPSPSLNGVISTVSTKHNPTENDAKPRGYWTVDNSKNVKLFFDSLAFEKHRDPLVPESWYDISWRDVADRKGHGLLEHYNTLAQALVDAYPTVPFQPHKFSRVSRNYWQSADNRRMFFDAIAQENMFDPLVPEAWYKHMSPALFFKRKGIWNVLEKHNFSYETALRELYPEIGFSKSAMRTHKAK